MARKWMVLLSVLAVFVGAWTVICWGDVSDEELQAAIDAGVAWLAAQQYPDGHWGDEEVVASTGFSVLKLADYGYEVAELDPDVDGPFDPDYVYHGEFMTGLNYILDSTESYPGDPGICYSMFPSGHETYNTAVALMAIAGVRNPDYVYPGANPHILGLNLKQIAALLVHYFEYAQNADGGWRYWYTNDPSDNSNTGFVVLGLRYAEALGCSLSDAMKTALSGWLDGIQNQPGPADDGWEFDPDGGGGYTTPDSWVNLLKTGNLLFEFAFVGDAPDTARILAAIDYIQRHWNDLNWDPGWKGGDTLPNLLAAYCLMKGLEAIQLETLLIGGLDIDWFAEMAEAIVDSQNADGSWNPSDWDWSGGLWSTQWALLTLEKVTPPPPVLIDIKPGSFPNSINPAQKGTTPVAIFSNEMYDLPSLVILTSLTFGATGDEASLSYKGKGGAVPHCSFEDVDGDGLLDIVAHFVTELCGFDVGDEVGYLKGTMIDGTEFVACDSVRIVPSYGKKDALDPAAVAQGLSIKVSPNPIRDIHTAYFNVAGPMALQVDELWVQIFDLSGSLVWEEQSADAEIAWHTNSLSGEYLANGVYIYRVLVLVDGQWVVGRTDTFAVSR